MSNSAISGINPFEVALTQLDEVSSIIGLDKGSISFLAQPKRYDDIYPVKMDEGTSGFYWFSFSNIMML